MFTFYILYSASCKKFYIGFTGEDIAERIRKHNVNHKGFTGRANDWQLVYSEIFETKEGAMKREKEVKSWKSAQKIRLLVDRASR
jgi:putative endonuclease